MSLDGEVSADVVGGFADDLEAPNRLRSSSLIDFRLAGPASADALRWLVDITLRHCSWFVATGLTHR